MNLISGIEYRIDTRRTTFGALKTFISFLYFDKLILKDKDEDFQLIREVCELSKEHKFAKEWNAFVAIHLKKRINVENFVTISDIAFDYKIDSLIEKLNEMKAVFIKPCD